MILVAIFATSLGYIRKGYIHTGAWITTVSILILTIVVWIADNLVNYPPLYASTGKATDSVKAIEEILSGISEIDTGTRDVKKSITSIVDDSSTNTGLVENVASEITQQNKALENIALFTENLTQRVSSLDALLANIKSALSEIENNASANEIVAAKISSVLD